jgi:hypothetical protein
MDRRGIFNLKKMVMKKHTTLSPMMKRVLYSNTQLLHINSTKMQIKQKELEEN